MEQQLFFPSGYTGKNCSIDIDDCTSVPCKNGGSCTDQVNSFECTCLAGYTGKRCEIDINECASSPCRNNATCVDQVRCFLIEYDCYRSCNVMIYDHHQSTLSITIIKSIIRHPYHHQINHSSSSIISTVDKLCSVIL